MVHAVGHHAGRAVVSRRRILDWATYENLLVHAYHMPFPGPGRITRRDGTYKWTDQG
jgi:hypothetical protein